MPCDYFRALSGVSAAPREFQTQTQYTLLHSLNRRITRSRLFFMATHRELAAQIRFQLEQLSVRNAHHDFEHLCRHLARNRICSNIVPATGPVTAGGDQGRDFETYETVADDSTGASIFSARVSGRRLAFACTLQKDGIADKVKSDVGDIVKSGTPVDGVHFLCAADIPVAKRHRLQEWASREYNVMLEIHDGQWISEELSQRDIFWIAQGDIPRQASRR